MTPTGWRAGKMLDFFELQRGFDITEKNAVPGMVPVISSSGVAYFHSIAKVHGPGVVTGRKGSVGQVHFVREDFWPHDTTLWVRDFKGNEPEYVKCFLEFMRLERFDEASSVPTLNRNNIHGVKCFFPSVAEQSMILDVLDTWDRAIDLTERLIAEKQKCRKGLMQQLLTRKKRLPGFDGEWRQVRLGDVFRNRTESGRTDLSLVAITADRGVILRDEINRKDNSSADKSKYLHICLGDIGYNTMRMWQGVSDFLTLEGIVSPAYTIITPKEKLDGEFMAIMFKFPPVVHLFYRYSQGLVSDTWNLKFRHFSEIKVTIPDETEQKAIAKVFKTIDREFDLLQAKVDVLCEQKKGLMQQLLTGKIRVKV